MKHKERRLKMSEYSRKDIRMFLIMTGSIQVIIFLLLTFLVLDGFSYKENDTKSVDVDKRPIVINIYTSAPESDSYILPDEPPEEPAESTATKEFTITAYDNTPESQGKWVDQTATGFNLKGHSLESARCIAVDPKVIPLGSKVELFFDENYKHLNGIYIARDTGGAIKGKKIDLFMGDGVAKQDVMNFGKRKVQVKLLE